MTSTPPRFYEPVRAAWRSASASAWPSCVGSNEAAAGEK